MYELHILWKSILDIMFIEETPDKHVGILGLVSSFTTRPLDSRTFESGNILNWTGREDSCENKLLDFLDYGSLLLALTV